MPPEPEAETGPVESKESPEDSASQPAAAQLFDVDVEAVAFQGLVDGTADRRGQRTARAVGAALLERLQDLKQKHEAIGDVRGRGLMLAIEMVKDRNTKEPDRETTSAVFEACRESRLILSKSGPTQSVLRMVPPMCLSLDDVDEVADGLDRAFSALG